MTTSEFKKVARLLKDSYKELEKEALDEGIDIFSEEFKTLQDALREKILSGAGFTLEEYRSIKDSLAKEGVRSVIANEVMPAIQATKNQVEEVAKLIQTPEEIAQIAHEVAKTYIKPPQITNQIVKETIVEKPTIVKETKVEQIVNNLPFDSKPIETGLEALSKRVDGIKIPEPVDVEKLKEDLKGHFGKAFEKNINVLGMPDFRKLAMGLQGQIDDVRRGSFTLAGINGSIQYNHSGVLAGSTSFLLDNASTQISFGSGSWINESANIANFANETPGGGIGIFADNTAGTITLSGANIYASATSSVSISSLGPTTISGDSIFLNGNTGVGTATPLGIFDVQQTNTIAQVQSPSVSFSYGGTATGNYAANGYLYGFRVYALDIYGSPIVSSVVSATATNTDNGSSNPMKITFSWTAVSGASGYRLFIYDQFYYGSNYDAYIDVYGVTSVIFGGPAASDEDNENRMQGGDESTRATVISRSTDWYVDTHGQWISPSNGLTLSAASIMTASGGSDANMPRAVLTLQAGDQTRNNVNNFLSTSAILLLGPTDTSNPNIFVIGTYNYVAKTDGTDTFGMIDYLGRWCANPGLVANFGPYFIDASMIVSTRVSSAIGLIMRGLSGQSGDLAVFQSSTGANLLRIDASGNLIGASLTGSNLTSGRIPIVTTSGKLVDDSDFTFATDTLTVTKIAATTFTGNVTLSTKNIVTDTTTGTKIGTGTTQKLGFFNSTPVVQPGAYTPTNVTTDRSYDANSTTLDEVADVLGTLIADLKSLGLIG